MIGGAKIGGVIGAIFGPEGIPIGAGIGVIIGGMALGTATGMAGYFGGSQGTRWVMERYAPDLLYNQEYNYIQSIRKEIKESIIKSQTMPTY